MDPRIAAEQLARLRHDDPVHRDERNGFWLITRHADVKQLSRQPELFSSEPHGPWHEFESHFSMQAQDGPPHHRTRNVVSRGFTPRKVAQLEDSVRRYADEAIDAVKGAGACDFVDAIALPVPARIIADMLGIGSRFELFQRWVEVVTGATTHQQELRETEDLAVCEAFEEYVRSVVEERAARPGDDLISAMLDGREMGALASFARDPFPGVPAGDAVLGFISFLVLAGSETTRHAISGGMHALILHPEQRELLTQRPQLLPSAVEEILRWVSPVRAMRRTVMRDGVELRGKRLSRGDSVVLIYTSANRDEAVFAEPEEFRIDRRPNDHVSFGFGTHFCMGANLARMEIRVTLARVLTRLPDLQMAPGAKLERHPSSIVNGLVHMPVIFKSTA
jgi:cytochrome P450 family 142 subfamily A polypeptide 1